MRSRILYLTVLSILLLLPSLVSAQDDGCPATVYYYEGTGQDVGQCTDREKPCMTFEYALEQGQNLCRNEVDVFYDDPNNPFVQVDSNPPPASTNITDTLWLVGRWAGPAIGLIVGWLAAAWVWSRRGQGGVE